MLKAIAQRRSIRRRTQPWYFVSVHNPQIKEKHRKALADMIHFEHW